jgi:hypothetical protein
MPVQSAHSPRMPSDFQQRLGRDLAIYDLQNRLVPKHADESIVTQSNHFVQKCALDDAVRLSGNLNHALIGAHPIISCAL